MRRWVGALGILVVIAGVTWLAYRQVPFWGQASKNVPYETVTVTRGDLVATVSATGTLEAADRLTLSFAVGGQVAKVLVAEGERVSAGQVLVQLDDTDARLQVAQAEANLRAAEAQLAQLKATPAPADVEAAKAALAAAEAAYRDLLAKPDPDEVAVAKAAVEQARVDLEIAQSNYDRVSWMPGIKARPESRQLQIATINYEKALAQFRLAQKPPSEGQIAQALANIAQARANLDRLTRGPDPEQVAAQEAAVDRARVALEQARLALARTVLRAPIAGTVARVHVKAGEWVSPGQPAVEIVVLRPLSITVYVDEMDVPRVKVGQTARITVDALPDRTFTGKVTYLAPVPTVQGGVVTYEAKVELVDDDPSLRPGMSAAVDIVVAEAKGVLLLPNRVIRVDRQTGTYYVEKLEGDLPTRVDVEIGLQNEQYSEIRAGLAEGDVVILRTVSTEEQLRQGLGLGR